MGSKIKSDKNIRIKVFAGFVLLLLLAVFIAFVTFRSFNNLTRSSDKLAAPNLKISLLHDIIFSLYQAESNIRNYTLTNREEFLDLYFEELEIIDQRVDSLYLLSGDDSYFSASIDSINVLLAEKILLLEQFIELKTEDKNSVFYEMAMEKIIIAADNQQSKVAEKNLLALKEETVMPGDPLLENEGVEATDEPEAKRNFFSRVRNFFAGNKDNVKTEEQIIVAEDMNEDTSADLVGFEMMVTPSDAALRADIKRILNSVKRMATQYQNELSQRENEILLKDKSIMDQVWYVVTLLEKYESTKDAYEAREAHQIVKQSSGTILWIIFLCLLIFVLFMALIFYDISRSRYYKQQLLEQKDRAENLVRIRQKFMAAMSHEVRTPLGAIIGINRQLGRTHVNAEQKEYVDIIDQSASHLLGIVNDILDFSKIDAGKLTLESIPVNLEELAREVKQAFYIVAKEKNLEFSIGSNGFENTLVYGDPLRIRQILLNLTGNAIKFTSHGYVKLHLSQLYRDNVTGLVYVKMEIEDSGPGIASEQQKAIFEEFAQANEQTSRKYGGTGLGLSISARLVEMMHGNISLVSDEGKGTTFTVVLPMKEIEATEDVHLDMN